MRVFLDTSYLVASLDETDQWYEKASETGNIDYIPITSHLVINETLSLLQRRGFLSAALEFLQQMQSSTFVEIIYVDPVLQREAWELFARYGGSGASVVDCSSFAIMRRLQIRQAFTFDRHFRAAGFHTL